MYDGQFDTQLDIRPCRSVEEPTETLQADWRIHVQHLPNFDIYIGGSYGGEVPDDPPPKKNIENITTIHSSASPFNIVR